MTKSLSTGVEDISIGGGVATHIESKRVEQDGKMNEGKAGIGPSQEIQVEEGLNLLDKQDGIDIVSNNNIDISIGFLFLIFPFPSYIFISPCLIFYSFCRYPYKIRSI